MTICGGFVAVFVLLALIGIGFAWLWRNGT